ncbi:hypothetical protein JCM3765_003892 [Sporobolomyces pararoseus]
MGGGDLNMKKSWHTGTFANQERVWKREQEALAERKKVQQLQKELEQERQVQELQRLQSESGGGKTREDRVEWLYAAPAESNGVNTEELESYLLGKKRVDKLLKGNEEKLMASQSSSSTPAGGTFTASSSANTARDTAAKIREDPLLAIKRQEQLQYEKMLKDPKRLKELRAAREGTGGKSGGGESKEERRARREKRRTEREDRHRERDRDRKSSRRSNHREDSYEDREYRRRSKSPRRRSYREEEERERERERPSSSSRRYQDDNHDYRSSSSRPPYRGNGYSSHSTTSTRPPPTSEELEASEVARKAAISARLQAMQSSAQTLSDTRMTRLSELELQDEKEKELQDELLKEKGRSGDGTGPRFMREIEKGVFGGGQGGVAERIRRSGKIGTIKLGGDE